MNITKKKIEKEDFDHQYAIIHREFTKISKNMTCNGIGVYDAIFTIISNEGGFEEALYWLVGDFMYTFAKEKRKIITDSSSWFELYCSEFKHFSYVVKSIDALCLSLNDLMKNEDRGRKIDEFGYLLWERSVIQQIKSSKEVTLSEALLQNIENPPQCFLSALESLSLIVPEKKDREFYYRTVYEEKAIDYICSNYENIKLYDDIFTFMRNVKEIFEREKSRLNKIFLPQSYDNLISRLDYILLIKNSHYICSKLRLIVETNIQHFSCLYHMVKIHSKFFNDVCKEVLSNSIVANLRTSVLEKSPKKIGKWFVDLHHNYLKAMQMYKSCFNDAYYVSQIFRSECNRLKDPSFGKLLGKFSNFCTKIEEFQQCKKIFSVFVSIIEDKSDFYNSYITYFGKRLLSYKADLKKEIVYLEILKSKSSFLEYKKCLKMLKDISCSYSFYKNNYFDIEKIICNHFTKIENHENTKDGANFAVNNNDLVFFTSILTFCAWPYSDTSTYQNIKLPKAFEEYIDYVKSTYTRQNQARTIKFNHDLGVLDVEIRTDKLYNFRLNMYQYIVISQYNDGDAYSLGELEKLTNLKTVIVKAILDTFKSLIILKSEKYYFNNGFKSTNTYFNYKDFEYRLELIKSKEFDIKSYYKALVARTSKQNKILGKVEFIDKVKIQFMKELHFDEDLYNEILKETEESGLIEVKDNYIYYDP